VSIVREILVDERLQFNSQITLFMFGGAPSP